MDPGNIPADVRFHQSLEYWESDTGTAIKTGDYPASVSLVRDARGNPTGIQRTWLTPDGHQAPVPKPKKALGPISGGAIRFGEPNGSLNIAEGPETALAIYQSTGSATWSTVSAPGMSKLELPPGIRTLNIWADRDTAGQEAANALASRAHSAGIEVYVSLPPERTMPGDKAADWLDVHNTDGPGAIIAALERGEPWKPPAPTEEKKRYTLYSAKDAFKPQPEREQIVKGLIGRRGVHIIAGESGCGKTYSAIDMAVTVSTGSQWLGHETVQTPAAFVDEESGHSRLSQRERNALRGHNASENTPFYFTCLEGFNFTPGSPDGDHLKKLITETGAGLVIIDALADVMMGGDENSVKDVQPVFHTLRTIAEETDSAIVLIHHVNKQGKYRGSSAMKGAVDLLLIVEKKQGSRVIEFQCEKCRDGELKPFAATATFEPDRFRLDLNGLEPVSKSSRLGKPKRCVIKLLEEHGSLSIKEIKSKADTCAPGSAKNAVYELADEGVIHRVDDGGQGEEATYAITKGKLSSLSCSLEKREQ